MAAHVRQCLSGRGAESGVWARAACGQRDHRAGHRSAPCLLAVPRGGDARPADRVAAHRPAPAGRRIRPARTRRRTGRQGRAHRCAGAGWRPPGTAAGISRTRAHNPGHRGLVAADVPGRRVRGRDHRGRPGTIGAPGRRGDDRRDRPGTAPGGTGDRLRRFAGARHGGAGRPAPLGAPGRPAERRGGAGPLAGRQDHQVLRPGPGARAVHRGRAPGQLDPVADRVVRVGGDALAAARPRRVAQAGARRTRGPVRRVARGAAGDLGQQAPPRGSGGRAAPPGGAGAGSPP